MRANGIGFNTFYTFRDGESAWVYAKVLRLLNQLVGVTCISIDPYQLGFHNEEAIESGAFWFYRKLGFRPTRPELAKLVMVEEKKIASDPKYRTPARVLRRLSEGNAIYEAPALGTAIGIDSLLGMLVLLFNAECVKSSMVTPKGCAKFLRNRLREAWRSNPAQLD